MEEKTASRTWRSSGVTRQESPTGYPQASFDLNLPGRHEGLTRLKRWVAQNDARGLTFARAAQIACLEPHYFSRKFRELVGESFQEWRQRLRISWAVKTIQSESLSITEIMQLAGYRDRRAFERAIRRQTGSTPGRIRRASDRSSL